MALATRNNALCVEILERSHSWGIDKVFHPVLTRVTKSADEISKVSKDMTLWMKRVRVPCSGFMVSVSAPSFVHTQIQSICMSWGLHPREVLVVGDSLEDVEWGFHAGCQTCLVDIGAPHYTQTLQTGFAHYTIEGLAELKHIVTMHKQHPQENGS